MGFNSDEERAVSRLLAGRSSISRPEHEELVSSILSQVEEASPVSAPRVPWFSLALALAVAGLLTLWVRPSQPDATPFSARGQGGAPQVVLHCAPRCTRGGKLQFEVARIEGYSHVSLFAFRSDDSVIWYSPATRDESSMLLPPGSGTRLLPLQVELDEAHLPGAYEVVALFASRSLTRAEVQAAYEHRTSEFEVVVRTLEVE